MSKKRKKEIYRKRRRYIHIYIPERDWGRTWRGSHGAGSWEIRTWVCWQRSDPRRCWSWSWKIDLEQCQRATKKKKTKKNSWGKTKMEKVDVALLLLLQSIPTSYQITPNSREERCRRVLFFILFYLLHRLIDEFRCVWKVPKPISS